VNGSASVDPEIPVRDGERLRAAVKVRDTWWPTVFSGPVANHLVRVLSAYPRVHPNHVSIAGALTTVVACTCFGVGTYPWLVAGALLLQLAFVLDCADGQLARYRRSSSPFGAVLDRILDRTKPSLIATSLAWGATGDASDRWPWVAAVIVSSGPLLVEMCGQQYVLLTGGRPAGDRRTAGFPFVLRLLDLPFLRPFCGDHYFLVSVLCLAGQVRVLLLLLAGFTVIQLFGRPVYYLVLLRRDHGRWPWYFE
jgi:phosphatidylglycerophosphate synthase